nr:hypothetical protein [Tanacetum cinerariifolium]
MPIAKRMSFKSCVGKLTLAAAAYFVWQERNFRLLKNSKRSIQEVVDCVMSSVRLKLLSCRFKKSKDAVVCGDHGESVSVPAQRPHMATKGDIRVAHMYKPLCTTDTNILDKRKNLSAIYNDVSSTDMFSNRDIARSGFSLDDLVLLLLDDIDDVILWRDRDDVLRPFLVACVWDMIRTRADIVN